MPFNTKITPIKKGSGRGWTRSETANGQVESFREGDKGKWLGKIGDMEA